MQTFRLFALIATVSLSTGMLGGEEVWESSGQSTVTMPQTLVEEVVPTMESEPVLEEVEETQIVEINEPEVAVEVETEDDLTYDQQTQREVGEEEAPVPEEVKASWYVEETAIAGLELILQTYAIDNVYFVIDSAPSNYVYQYELYADSPDGSHVNLIGIFQYGATGKQTFQLDVLTGVWE